MQYDDASELYQKLYDGINPKITFTYWDDLGERYYLNDALDSIEITAIIDAEAIAYDKTSFVQAFNLYNHISKCKNIAEKQANDRLQKLGYTGSCLDKILIRLHCENWTPSQDIFESVKVN